jgi:L-alanine-DL-glutamate epimerase-like enolase superfamily enzyme
LARAETLPELKIDRIETFPVSYPTAGRFKFFEGPRGEQLGHRTVIVKITADDGSVGWGQSVPSNKWSYETPETVKTTIDGYLAPVLIGRNAFDIDALHTAMNTIIAPSFSTGQPICKAGVDLALFDLTCKHLGQTAANVGAARAAIANHAQLDAEPPVAGRCSATDRRGVSARVPQLQHQGGARSRVRRRVVPAVKRLVPDGFLWADANGGYDEATALAVAPRSGRRRRCRAGTTPAAQSDHRLPETEETRRACRSSWTKAWSILRTWPSSSSWTCWTASP